MFKIIFLTDFPFNKNDYERYGLEILKKRGLNCKVWDISSLNNIELSINNKNQKFNDLLKNVEYFSDKKKLFSAIEKQNANKTLIILLIGKIYFLNFQLMRRISKLNLKYAFHFYSQKCDLSIFQSFLKPGV